MRHDEGEPFVVPVSGNASNGYSASFSLCSSVEGGDARDVALVVELFFGDPGVMIPLGDAVRSIIGVMYLAHDIDESHAVRRVAEAASLCCRIGRHDYRSLRSSFGFSYTVVPGGNGGNGGIPDALR